MTSNWGPPRTTPFGSEYFDHRRSDQVHKSPLPEARWVTCADCSNQWRYACPECAQHWAKYHRENDGHEVKVLTARDPWLMD